MTGVLKAAVNGGLVVLAGLLVGGCAQTRTTEPGPSRPELVATQSVVTWERLPVSNGVALPATFGPATLEPAAAGPGAHSVTKAAKASPLQTGDKRAAVEALAAIMAGSYDSNDQSQADAAYFDIRLHMTRIWPERADGAWLYVEQAMSTAQQKPYRQRVYKLSAQDDGTLTSEVFELPGDPLRFTGAWQDVSKLDGVTPAQLTSRDGCEITLTRNADGTYTGGTRPGACPSQLRGASYATSEVTLSERVLMSWDRGFNDKGEQVWGATAGGYIFRKR